MVIEQKKMGPKKSAAAAQGDEEDVSCDKFYKEYRKNCVLLECPVNPRMKEMYEEYVEEGKQISKIHLWTELGWQGTKAIIEAMITANYKHCESIRLWKGRCFDEGARHIALYLTKFHNCTVLELLDCQITSLGCEFLMPAFTPKIGGNLTMIKLDHNPIGDEGCWILAAGLAKNPELIMLSLSYCNIGNSEKGPEGLFEILIY